MIDIEIEIGKKFNIDIDEADVNTNLSRIREIAATRITDKEALKRCFASIDLTTLNTTDGNERAEQFAKKVSNFPAQFPDTPNVAAICVYPTLVPAVRQHLKAHGVKIAAVAAGFPSSQTFLGIKLSECEMTLEKGADELDVVISCGSFLDGDYHTVYCELQQIQEVAGDNHVKVILETGALPTLRDVKLASFIAMEAGANFIKTSTGKLEPAATPEAVYAMCQCIKEYHSKTGRKVGIKPAGGMATSADALVYYTIVEQVLGSEWLNPKLFRIGASRLANKILSDIYNKEINYF